MELNTTKRLMFQSLVQGAGLSGLATMVLEQQHNAYSNKVMVKLLRSLAGGNCSWATSDGKQKP
eukprot:8174583-Pyramimonas_sp.AAC.1